MEWQPIETAPKDRRILLSNYKQFSAGAWYERHWIETETIPNYSMELLGSPLYGKPIPNPKAGQPGCRAAWFIENPVAFLSDDQDYPDFDGNFEQWNPTHWVPLPEPPPLQRHSKGET